jgi:hypothetical protein
MAQAAAGPDARARRLAVAQPRHTPTRIADQQAWLLWANQGLRAQNSSKVLLKTCFQALLQPALPTQAKDLQVGPALGAIHWRNAAHGADLRDGSSGEACHKDSDAALCWMTPAADWMAGPAMGSTLTAGCNRPT